jgi:hypothetical protein
MGLTNSPLCVDVEQMKKSQPTFVWVWSFGFTFLINVHFFLLPYASCTLYYFIRLHQTQIPSLLWEVNNLNWGCVVSRSSSGLCGYEEYSFGLWCRFRTHVVLLLLDFLSNSWGRSPLTWCGEILCDRAHVSTHTLLPPFPLLEFPLRSR